MSEEKADTSKAAGRGKGKTPKLDPRAVATLKNQLGDEVIDVLRLEEGVIDLGAIIENAKAEVSKRQVAISFNQVALQRRVYENEIVRQDAAIFKELAGLVQSIGERYRTITGLPPTRKG